MLKSGNTGLTCHVVGRRRRDWKRSGNDSRQCDVLCVELRVILEKDHRNCNIIQIKELSVFPGVIKVYLYQGKKYTVAKDNSLTNLMELLLLNTKK